MKRQLLACAVALALTACGSKAADEPGAPASDPPPARPATPTPPTPAPRLWPTDLSGTSDPELAEQLLAGLDRLATTAESLQARCDQLGGELPALYAALDPVRAEGLVRSLDLGVKRWLDETYRTKMDAAGERLAAGLAPCAANGAVDAAVHAQHGYEAVLAGLTDRQLGDHTLALLERITAALEPHQARCADAGEVAALAQDALLDPLHAALGQRLRRDRAWFDTDYQALIEARRAALKAVAAPCTTVPEVAKLLKRI